MSTISKECNFPDFGVPIIKGGPFWDTIVPSFVVWDILPCCVVEINKKSHLCTSGTYSVFQICNEAILVTIHMIHGLFSLFLTSYLSDLLSLTSCLSYLLSLISYLLPPVSRISYLSSLIPHHSHTHSTMTRLPLLYKYYIYTARYPPVTLAWSNSNIPEF